MHLLLLLALSLFLISPAVQTQHARTQGALASQSCPDLGHAAGFSGFQFAPIGNRLEIVGGGGHDPWLTGNPYWFVLAYNAQRQDYVTEFISPSYAVDETILRLIVADLPGNPGPEVVLLLKDGSVEVWDQSKRIILRQMQTSAASPLTMEIADVNADGKLDLVITEKSRLWVYDATGKHLWNKPSIGGAAIAIGQMDADSNMEIACEDGQVIDAMTQTIDASLGRHYSQDMQARDIDGDSRDELLVCRNGVVAYDVDFKREKFRVTVSDTRFMATGDIDGNGTVDALVGTGQSNKFVAIDLTTRLITKTTRTDYSATGRLLIGDFDADNTTEIAWANGPGWHGPQPIQIQDPVTGNFEYQSHDVYSGLLGPFESDLDGDGKTELVTGSSGWRNGVRIFVHDNKTLEVTNTLAVSPGKIWTELLVDLDLVDIDGDGDDEIITTSDKTVLFDYDTSTKTIKAVWSFTFPGYPGERTQQTCVADFDGNGSLEFATATDKALYVYDFLTKQLLWSSFFIGKVTKALMAADTDGDSVLEIHCLSSDGNIYVFDGKTQLADAVIQPSTAKFSSMSIHSNKGSSFLLTGDEAGDVWAQLWVGKAFMSLGPLSLVSEPIDHFSLLSVSPFSILASNERLSILTGATPAWLTAQYGEGLGQRIILRPTAPHLITNGSQGLIGFDLK